jgi:hypothetical protein
MQNINNMLKWPSRRMTKSKKNCQLYAIVVIAYVPVACSQTRPTQSALTKSSIKIRSRTKKNPDPDWSHWSRARRGLLRDGTPLYYVPSKRICGAMCSMVAWVQLLLLLPPQVVVVYVL